MTDRELFSSPLVTIAEFTCPADDAAWRTTNVIESQTPLVAFPHMPVGVEAAGAPPLLATPNLVMLYNPGQEYERRLVDERGDRCLYLVLHPPALEELETAGCAIRDGRMTRLHAPADGRAYLVQHLLARQLRAGQPDPLLVEDAALRLVHTVLRLDERARAARPRTRSLHHELAEEAKEHLARSLAEPLSLRDLAARLAVSPFHLSRVFRAQTGYSLHEYRTQLRLRVALLQLPESRGALTPLARGLGFASHSHFTDSFRREFGVPPSALRDARELLAS